MSILVARRMGFTLVKLLVVIAIIGALVELVQEDARGVEDPLKGSCEMASGASCCSDCAVQVRLVQTAAGTFTPDDSLANLKMER